MFTMTCICILYHPIFGWLQFRRIFFCIFGSFFFHSIYQLSFFIGIHAIHIDETELSETSAFQIISIKYWVFSNDCRRFNNMISHSDSLRWLSLSALSILCAEKLHTVNQCDTHTHTCYLRRCGFCSPSNYMISHLQLRLFLHFFALWITMQQHLRNSNDNKKKTNCHTHCEVYLSV